MATIVTRASKGSALSHTEMDSNFTNLNTELADKVEETSAQALHATDALRIVGDTISLYKGNGTHEDVVLPAADSDTLYDTAHNFSSNGYQKLSNGLILQWGNTGSGTSIAFPVAFPASCLNLQGTQNLNGSEYDEVTMYVQSSSLFSARTTNSGGSIYWFAIGY